ncbi:MAG TPA: DmsE family decaheme c-type cytochrome [Cellvibrionaceae bacterium]
MNGKRALVIGFLWCCLLVMAGLSHGSEAEYVANDPDTCLMCHRDDSPLSSGHIMHGAHALTGNSRSPFAPGQQGCQSCHGPASAHMSINAEGVRPPPPVMFGSDYDPEPQNTVCLSCHTADKGHHWSGSAHEFAQLSCSSCHTVHQTEDSALGFHGKTGLCLDCHTRERAEILHPSTHPLRDGQMSCIDCHAPHGGPGPADLIAHTLNDQCYLCHAEKRGPFLWEHAPVAEDCTQCHKPHGSNHRDLLQARTPWLCQQCHLAPFHPSTALSGSGLPQESASANLLGRDCTNCHTQVHGSNHPSGAGLTR